MPFNFMSPEYYLFFLPFCLFLMIIVPRDNKSLQISILCIMSYLFFILASGWHIILLLMSTLVDWNAGKRIYNNNSISRRKYWLKFSIIINLSLLATFKYLDFIIKSLGWWSLELGYSPIIDAPNLLLPVGISFYTFQTMSYTIDIYREKYKPAKSFLDFACYAAFFPQLVAGPIVRFDHFNEQIKKPLKTNNKRFRLAITLIIYGLFKKMIFADNFALHVNAIFSTGAPLDNVIIIYWGALLFGLQIYCDFSAYTDIAIGSAYLFGIKLPENFDGPYSAKSPQEFWRKWHISLSTWLRDYLYISLGGSRHGPKRMYAALMITMVLGGLWHGASWNFALWGLFHGVILIIHRLISSNKLSEIISNNLPIFYKLSSLIITQWLIFLSWLIFRIEDNGMLLRSIKSYLFIDIKFDYIQAFEYLPGLQWLTISLVIFFIFFHVLNILKNNKMKYSLARLNLQYWSLLIGLMMGLIWLLRPQESAEFIYFRF